MPSKPSDRRRPGASACPRCVPKAGRSAADDLAGRTQEPVCWNGELQTVPSGRRRLRGAPTKLLRQPERCRAEEGSEVALRRDQLPVDRDLLGLALSCDRSVIASRI